MIKKDFFKHPNKMLRIGDYEIPENVYKDGGIETSVVNTMIEGTIALDEDVIDTAVTFCTIKLFTNPEHTEQLLAITNLCIMIEQKERAKLVTK